MKQKFINILVRDCVSNEPINGLNILDASGQQLNAVLQLAPANSIIEIEIKERVVDNNSVK